MTRRLRTALAILLCLLVTGMQAEVQRHALTHFVAYAGSHEQAIATPVDSTCAECALLAAGSAALAGVHHTLPLCACALEPAERAYAALPAHRPSYYRSRAPPALS